MALHGFLRRQLPVIAIVLMLVVAFGVGWYLGNRSPSGTKHAASAHGTAVLQNRAAGKVGFTAEDGDLDLVIPWHTVSWEKGDKTGEGRPPCLRKPGRKVKVEVGYLSVRLPGGEVHDSVVWVSCDG